MGGACSCAYCGEYADEDGNKVRNTEMKPILDNDSSTSSKILPELERKESRFESLVRLKQASEFKIELEKHNGIKYLRPLPGDDSVTTDVKIVKQRLDSLKTMIDAERSKYENIQKLAKPRIVVTSILTNKDDLKIDTFVKLNKKGVPILTFNNSFVFDKSDEKWDKCLYNYVISQVFCIFEACMLGKLIFIESETSKRHQITKNGLSNWAEIIQTKKSNNLKELQRAIYLNCNFEIGGSNTNATQGLHTIFWLFLTNYSNCQSLNDNLDLMSKILKNWKEGGTWWHDIPSTICGKCENVGNLLTLFVSLLNSNYGLWNWNNNEKEYGFDSIVSTQNENEKLDYIICDNNKEKFASMAILEMINSSNNIFHFQINVPRSIKGKHTISCMIPFELIKDCKDLAIEIEGINVTSRYCARAFLQRKHSVLTTKQQLSNYYSEIVNGQMQAVTKTNSNMVLSTKLVIDQQAHYNGIVLSIVDSVGTIQSTLDIYLISQ